MQGRQGERKEEAAHFHLDGVRVKRQLRVLPHHGLDFLRQQLFPPPLTAPPASSHQLRNATQQHRCCASCRGVQEPHIFWSLVSRKRVLLFDILRILTLRDGVVRDCSSELIGEAEQEEQVMPVAAPRFIALAGHLMLEGPGWQNFPRTLPAWLVEGGGRRIKPSFGGISAGTPCRGASGCPSMEEWGQLWDSGG